MIRSNCIFPHPFKLNDLWCWSLGARNDALKPTSRAQVIPATHMAGEQTLIQWQTLFVMVADISHSVKLDTIWPRYPLISRQRRAWAAAAFPCPDQSCLSPVPGLAPAPPSLHPLRRLRATPRQLCPADPLPPWLPPPEPTPGQEGHAALSRGDVRGVRDGAQPDGRRAQRGRRLLPHAAGRLLHPGGYAAHHPDQPVLTNERREGEMGQRATPSQREREKAKF